MQTLYSFLISIYGLGIRVAALFNRKAALWVKGRKNYFSHLAGALDMHMPQRAEKKVAWFHCASLGEFEQGRPLMEEFRRKYPEWYLVLTFYSPSGFEVRRTYTGADLVTYLPFDTRRNARMFVDMVKPNLVFYIKYEFWFNFLSQLQHRHIPTILVSAVFRPGQHFFKWYGDWPRKILKGFDRIFVQNDDSRELLQFIGIEHATVSGDTRFDRVAEVAAAAGNIEIAEAFTHGSKVLVAGSSWPADEAILMPLLGSFPDLKLIIAPHEIRTEHLERLRLETSLKTVLFSEALSTGVAEARVLIIDSVGMLSRLYQYATITYIGGGFGVGIHNILEAAAFAKPVIFGPNYHKFEEAKALTGLKGAFPVNNGQELFEVVSRLLNDDNALKASSEVSGSYVKNNTGATATIMKAVDQLV